MLIDFDKIIQDAAGRDTMLPGINGEAETAHLGRVCAMAMFAQLPGDDKLQGIEKAHIGELGLRFYSGGKVELSPEDAVIVRQRVGLAFAPLIVARVYSMIG